MVIEMPGRAASIWMVKISQSGWSAKISAQDIAILILGRLVHKTRFRLSENECIFRVFGSMTRHRYNKVDACVRWGKR